MQFQEGSLPARLLNRFLDEGDNVARAQARVAAIMGHTD